MYILLDRTVGGDPVGAEGGMRSSGVLSDGFKIPKCTSHLGFGLGLVLSGGAAGGSDGGATRMLSPGVGAS